MDSPKLTLTALPSKAVADARHRAQYVPEFDGAQLARTVNEGLKIAMRAAEMKERDTLEGDELLLNQARVAAEGEIGKRMQEEVYSRVGADAIGSYDRAMQIHTEVTDKYFGTIQSERAQQKFLISMQQNRNSASERSLSFENAQRRGALRDSYGDLISAASLKMIDSGAVAFSSDTVTPEFQDALTQFSENHAKLYAMAYGAVPNTKEIEADIARGVFKSGGKELRIGKDITEDEVNAIRARAAERSEGYAEAYRTATYDIRKKMVGVLIDQNDYEAARRVAQFDFLAAAGIASDGGSAALETSVNLTEAEAKAKAERAAANDAYREERRALTAKNEAAKAERAAEKQKKDMEAEVERTETAYASNYANNIAGRPAVDVLTTLGGELNDKPEAVSQYLIDARKAVETKYADDAKKRKLALASLDLAHQNYITNVSLKSTQAVTKAYAEFRTFESTDLGKQVEFLDKQPEVVKKEIKRRETARLTMERLTPDNWVVKNVNAALFTQIAAAYESEDKHYKHGDITYDLTNPKQVEALCDACVFSAKDKKAVTQLCGGAGTNVPYGMFAESMRELYKGFEEGDETEFLAGQSKVGIRNAFAPMYQYINKRYARVYSEFKTEKEKKDFVGSVIAEAASASDVFGRGRDDVSILEVVAGKTFAGEEIKPGDIYIVDTGDEAYVEKVKRILGFIENSKNNPDGALAIAGKEMTVDEARAEMKARGWSIKGRKNGLFGWTGSPRIFYDPNHKQRRGVQGSYAESLL